ncbi:hypothetical protein GLX30_01980 [Streptomyces sp. Tu 2975]|nr:hypothetical protein [Streptomyces sp. Tu 2975]QIP83055.1 hypothetical protein GLX30_01980 [Streptomyces sp. Tu 2975]
MADIARLPQQPPQRIHLLDRAVCVARRPGAEARELPAGCPLPGMEPVP